MAYALFQGEFLRVLRFTGQIPESEMGERFDVWIADITVF